MPVDQLSPPLGPTLSQQPGRGERSEKTSSRRTKSGVDFEIVRKLGPSVLRHGLNTYQQRLNSKLTEILSRAFNVWVHAIEAETLTQLKSVPRRDREAWLDVRPATADRRQRDSQTARLMVDFLLDFAAERLMELKRLRKGNQAFRSGFGKLLDDTQRQAFILAYAEELGANDEQLAGDEQAFDRWFDEEAVTDRFVRRVGEVELLLSFSLDRVASAVDRIFSLSYRYDGDPTGEDDQRLEARLSGIWHRLNLEGHIQNMLRCDADARVKIAALKTLQAIVKRFPPGLGLKLINKRMYVALHRIAIEARADIWVQCEAFSILSALSMDDALPIIRKRLAAPRPGDDMFVRRHLYKIISSHLLNSHQRDVELPLHADEPNEFVRQAMSKAVFLSKHSATQRQWSQMALEDPVSQVRASALLIGTDIDLGTPELIDFLQVVTKALVEDQDPFVQRVAMHVIVTVLTDTIAAAGDDGQDPHVPVSQNEARRETVQAFYQQRIKPRLQQLETNHQQAAVRRWAAQYHEQCWALIDLQARELLQRLSGFVATIPVGKSKRIKRSWVKGMSDAKLGRIFAVLSQADFGFDIQRAAFGVRVTRGPAFGFRLWRLIHELRHTATDKRQALRHTVGRINSAPLRAPSQILGELSETKIPGEPLTIASDSTWRPFLPLLDDFVSVLNRSWLFARSVSFVTSQGVTTVTGPRWIGKRIAAAVKLNCQFAKYATLRNWDDDSYPADSFIASMRGLGFLVEFSRHEDAAEFGGESDAGDPEHGSADRVSVTDDSVTRFFTATLCAIPMLGSLVSQTVVDSFHVHFLRYADYFGSTFENSIEQLLLFTVGLLLIVLGRHWLANYRFRLARRNIPLSIGGWGTRGKSGTERLKAALIGGMGHGLVSKTTGCEAMFIHGDPNGEPLEIPLFRPFDKATIWEQHNLILMASRLNPSVFLWECMALTPAFVDVLQRQWTCDDMGTITNTYPDHEDLQGPAGHDVATTISGFVPIKSHLITTEQVMRPYVQESCRDVETTLRGVGWLESGLVTEDVLERFPYKEHPDNVALVAAMGDELGVDYEFAVKAMGDYLVPDLGVLKTHPLSTVRTRQIEFTNGCSANERFGCMGNIRRLGFDTQDPWEHPGTWVCGVVNNRADRVPRSKVFAKIIVEDINADRYFLIGNNLKGLVGFIEDAWDERAATISLRDQGKPWDVEFALKTLKQSAWDLRQPVNDDHVRAKLRVMVAAVVDDATDAVVNDLLTAWDDLDLLSEKLTQLNVSADSLDSIQFHQRQWLEALAEYQSIHTMVADGNDQQATQIEAAYVATLRRWYFRKLVLVENYDATGEEVVAKVVDETPVGFKNRAIGLQNIKGTGLDFVYRFQAWDVCYEACEAILSSNPQAAEKGLQTLVSMPAIGQLCQTKIAESLAAARDNVALRRPDLVAQLDALEKRLQETQAAYATASQSSDADSGDRNNQGVQGSTASRLAQWNSWIVNRSEQVVDLSDSLRRRDTADRIYKDLADQRISRQRAVVELRNINKRQKGGWLTTKLNTQLAKFRK